MITKRAGERQVAILGFGLEGRALFFYLKKDKKTCLTILDKKRDLKLPRGVNSVLGKNYLKNLSRFDVVYRSPGVPFNLPEIQKVKHKVSSLSKLFFESVFARGGRQSKGKIIGITGSAGKTTTATLLYKILKNAKKDAYLVGNIGINSLGVLNRLSSNSVTVMELSSFQLQDLECSPHGAIILDIYEEHLDKHKTFKEYLKAKGNIFRFQKKKDFSIYALDNKPSASLKELSHGRKMTFSLHNASADIFIKSGAIFHKKKGEIIKLSEVRLLGEHNYKNIMAATLAALSVGVAKNIIRKTVSVFRDLPHRVEFVRKLNGVEFYNNSKATNVFSAIAGLDTFTEPKVVLAGGYNKNLDLSPLARRLIKPDIRYVILFGRARFELSSLLKKFHFRRFASVKHLKEAIGLTKKHAMSGDVAILSPATASFDEFSSYKERGERFKEWVQKL